MMKHESKTITPYTLTMKVRLAYVIDKLVWLSTKGLLTGIVCMAFCKSVQAQSNKEWAIRGGTNVAYLGGEETGFTARLGLHLGGYVRKTLSPTLAIQGGLAYSLQGAQDEEVNEIKLDYGYLAMPLTARLYFYKRFTLGVGLRTAYLIHATSNDPLNPTNIVNNLNRVDFSLLLGTDVRITPEWSFGARFNYGITNTAKSAPNRNSRFPNRVFQFSIARHFPIKEKDKEKP